MQQQQCKVKAGRPDVCCLQATCSSLLVAGPGTAAPGSCPPSSFMAMAACHTMTSTLACLGMAGPRRQISSHTVWKGAEGVCTRQAGGHVKVSTSLATRSNQNEQQPPAADAQHGRIWKEP